MGLAPGQAADAVERHGCPKCAAPAGSACRTRGGKTAVKYHTARFILVPTLKDKGVPVPGSAGKLTTKAGKDAGKNPSAASLYRALAEPGETAVVPGPARAPVPGTGRSHDRERARP
jgi:hypothetical protein